MPGTLAPNAKFTGLDDEGNPLVGGLLHTYLAHTSTPADTFSDVDLGVPNANPVVLDAGGRATVFLDLLTYKFILTDKDGSLVWSQDDIASDGLGGGGAGGGTGVDSAVFQFGGESSTPVTENSYPVGPEVAKLHAGTAVMDVDSANLIGSYAVQAMMAVDDATTVLELALVNLSDGDPDTPMVAIQSSSVDGERKTSNAIVFPLSGAVKSYGIKAKCSEPAGYAWMIKLVRTTESGGTTFGATPILEG